MYLQSTASSIVCPPNTFLLIFGISQRFLTLSRTFASVIVFCQDCLALKFSIATAKARQKLSVLPDVLFTSLALPRLSPGDIPVLMMSCLITRNFCVVKMGERFAADAAVYVSVTYPKIPPERFLTLVFHCGLVPRPSTSISRFGHMDDALCHSFRCLTDCCAGFCVMCYISHNHPRHCTLPYLPLLVRVDPRGSAETGD